MAKTHKTYTQEDIIGKKFGRLTPIRIVDGYRSKWLCQCDCGNLKEVYAGMLIRGQYKSCGCLENENRKSLKKRTIKHGMTETILYKKWCGIKARCYNPNYKYFNRYGGRGITMCEEWQGEHGFENFAKWAYEAGYDDSKHTFEQTIDRIDTDGNYEPSNCKWSTQTEQVGNRSNAFLIADIDGERLTSTQFDKKHGITAESFSYRRARRGKNAQQILDEWDSYVEHINGDYFSILEAADYYGVKYYVIKNWIKKGKIKADYVRNKYYIPKGQPNPNLQGK